MKLSLPQNFKKRLIMTIGGVLLCSLAVGFFKESAFGVDPFQCFAQGTHGGIFTSLIPSYGTYYIMISLVFLAVDLLLDKHYIGIATFINLFLTGYIVEFSANTIHSLVPDPTLPVRVAFLLFGIVVMCIAASLYMTSDLGVSVYDAIPIIISNRTPVPFRFCRIGTDVICVLIGLAAGLLPGLGTLITAFFMGPLVDLFNRKLSRPLLEGKKKNA